MFNALLIGGVALSHPVSSVLAKLEVSYVHVENTAKVPTQEVPYTIDLSEVEGGVVLLSTNTRLCAATSGTLTYALSDSAFEPVYLLGTNDALVAMDVVARGVKETITFSAKNSAKADVVLALSLTGLSYKEILRAYSRIEDHPQFAELREIYRASKQVPLTDDVRAIARKIAIDIYEDMRTGISTQPEKTIDGFRRDSFYVIGLEDIEGNPPSSDLTFAKLARLINETTV